ncbi:FeS cluster biogenesis domain and Ribosomal protein L27 family and FeS cluster insertion protein family-containing protein [Strongyloides ratti]|uniref:FeS cluster biogenesis domain and Ribosomal protein L27 family and FeS cluster insertion protein family-containing protein n=1 Tax=Strongyloides ratti TaxID=34506 RepID=A0A090LE58_STRRB|nr:FeS cluster biogenesis domain and Ribosomal protein L27 family and FeS cluster insertion protein family-containing protein [Strongyloides ratti]CEF65770.1 FeS cluster biogenesis domain and Ribosomal protein L27 family and FeS cluster insertion protein family-containing protein [Strongyloides ratti]
MTSKMVSVPTKNLIFTSIRTLLRPPANIPFQGVYRQNGETVLKDELLIVQKRFNWHPGRNVYFEIDRSFCLIKAMFDGKVLFSREKVDLDMTIPEIKKEYGSQITEDLYKLTVNVIPFEEKVQGGGCSGFEYKFRFDNILNKNQDLVFGDNDAKVVVDDISMEYLKGATVDYVSELLRTSFKIVKNPIAEKGCSCGSSFAPRLD